METVLVVDDNEANCDLVCDVITTWGYEVYKAFQGQDALTIAKEKHPDIILLDIMLPGMNGFEVCHELKSLPDTQDIPIIMLTVLTDTEDRIHGFKVGADHFLTKPISYHELRYIIESAVRRKQIMNRMEEQQHIVESYLQMYQLCNEKLYKQVQKLQYYCERLAAVCNYSDVQTTRLLMAAGMQDIGLLVCKNAAEHGYIGRQIVAPFKMSKWLGVLLEYHHKMLNDEDFPHEEIALGEVKTEMEALVTINRFIDLCEQFNQKQSIVHLLNESRQGRYSEVVVQALEQIIQDEEFVRKYDDGTVN